jgi:hypothetical protein
VRLGGHRRWSAGDGDPERVVEARGTGGLAGERRRRAVIRDLLVGRRLVGVGARGVALAGGSSSKATLHEGEVEAKLLPGLNGNERTSWWPTTVNGDGESREQSKAEAGERECGGGEMGKDFSTEPMGEGIRVPRHGGDGDNRRWPAPARSPP